MSPVLACLPAYWTSASALPLSLPACLPNGLTDCPPPTPLLICRTYFPSTRICKQFGYSGWSEVATAGVVSGITRPSGLLPQTTATGCSGGFCSFVPQSAAIRQVMCCLVSTVPSCHVCLPIVEPLLAILSSPPLPLLLQPQCIQLAATRAEVSQPFSHH